MSHTKIIVLTTREDPRGPFPEWLTLDNYDAFTFVIAFDPKTIELENNLDDIYERLSGMYSAGGGVVHIFYDTLTHQGGIILRHSQSDPVGHITHLMSIEEASIQ